ncbi:hypothetical protein GB937_003544 [Aspergillus fischeri]|nr:hypothetical protein GB937_003544 [Aspergillus fischeri]
MRCHTTTSEEDAGFTDINVCLDSKPNMLRAQAERGETWTNPNVAAKVQPTSALDLFYVYEDPHLSRHG